MKKVLRRDKLITGHGDMIRCWVWFIRDGIWFGEFQFQSGIFWEINQYLITFWAFLRKYQYSLNTLFKQILPVIYGMAPVCHLAAWQQHCAVCFLGWYWQVRAMRPAHRLDCPICHVSSLLLVPSSVHL